MKENYQPILLIRISQKKYNNTLYDKHILYMNPQRRFSTDSNNLTKGQGDPDEGLIAKISISQNNNRWLPVATEGSIKIIKNSDAFIFCTYAVQFNPEFFNQNSRTYTQIIPWSYIKDFSIGGDTSEIEMLIFTDSVAFRDCFVIAAKKKGLQPYYGLIKYDQEKKAEDGSLFQETMENPVAPLFYKNANKYGIQNEYRLAVICPGRMEPYELPLEDLENVKGYRMDLLRGQDIVITFKNVELQPNGHFKTFNGLSINFKDVKEGNL